MKPEPYRSIVDDAGRALCGWIESKGNRCFDNATHLDKRVKAFFCKKHAEITRFQIKHHQLVELPIDDDNQMLKQRIKRLEEAGDKMEAWLRDERLDAVQHTVSKWNKAKEDKP